MVKVAVAKDRAPALRESVLRHPGAQLIDATGEAHTIRFAGSGPKSMRFSPSLSQSRVCSNSRTARRRSSAVKRC
jgi:hypothetical protein